MNDSTVPAGLEPAAGLEVQIGLELMILLQYSHLLGLQGVPHHVWLPILYQERKKLVFFIRSHREIMISLQKQRGGTFLFLPGDVLQENRSRQE